MSKLKKYNLSGQSIGEIEIDPKLAEAQATGQMIKDYIVALRTNARQWSASTKTRGEVNHSTKKPHSQKGGGRARQGMLSAPQYKGGGRVFGPRPKFDQHVRINKKEKRAAIRFLLSEKIRENRLHVIENTELEQAKTKVVASFIKERKLPRRVLFLGEATYLDLAVENETMRFSMPTTKHENFIKSLRNIPTASFSLATNISGYDILCANDIVVTEAALQELHQWLC